MATCWRGKKPFKPAVYRNLVFLLSLCMFLVQVRYAHPQETGNEFEDSRNRTLDEPESPRYETRAEPAFSGARAWDQPLSRGVGQTLTAGLIASGYCLLSNGIVMVFNRFVVDAPWAFPYAGSIRRNFTEPWKWEDLDGFKVNHLGHPLQGMVYFSAGRVTGFGFYGSIFFSAFGSFAWETVGERQRASINDLIITAPTGVSFGEIMYRLYLQAHAAGVPAFLTFLINPTAGVHRLLTGWEPPAVERNLYEFRAYLSAAYAHTTYTLPGSLFSDDRPKQSHSGFFGDVGFRIIYGDPFVQNTWVPFRQFEFFGSFGTDTVNHNDFRLFTDGYLFSFSPLHSETRALSHGLSLFFDFASIGNFDMYFGFINMYSNALGWSVKYRHLFSPNVGWRARAHAGFTFFGASSFYHYTRYGNRREMLNYGYGISLRHLSGFEFGRRARIDVSNFFYFQWTYPGINPALSQGFVWWQFHDFSFSHLVSQRISLGATFSIATERGSFGGDIPSTRKNNWSVRTFVAWNGQSIRN